MKKKTSPIESNGKAVDNEIAKLHQERAEFERKHAEIAREFYKKNSQALENARIRRRQDRREKRRAELNLEVIDHTQPAAAAPAAAPEASKP